MFRHAEYVVRVNLNIENASLTWNTRRDMLKPQSLLNLKKPEFNVKENIWIIKQPSTIGNKWQG